MQSDLVSICIPVYNGQKYIRDTLDSLLCQTYENVELVISDNASTDATVDILRDYQRTDPRICILENKANEGYCRNIARSVAHAKSDKIAIFHADDIYDKAIIENELAALDANHDISAVFCRIDKFKDSVASAEPMRLYDVLMDRASTLARNDVLVGDFHGFSGLFLEYGNFIACPSFMTYKSQYLELGGFSDRYPSSEDLELWMRYLLAGKKLGIINRTLMHYRLSETQGSSYYNKIMDLPIEFKLMDEMLIPRLDTTYTCFIEKYNMRKSRSLIYKYYQALDGGFPQKAHELLDLSRRIHTFSRFSREGFVQYNPCIASLIHRAARII